MMLEQVFIMKSMRHNWWREG